MKAEIISIGNEVMTGKTLDRNAWYLSRKLTKMGIDTYYKSTVGDDEVILEETFKRALNRSNIIITTGGLGPTEDDITKEVFSKTLNLDLIFNEKIFSIISEKLKDSGRPVTNTNKKEALIPEDSIALNNNVGTAPGIYFKKNNKIIIMLPGPHNEVKDIFEKEVIKLISSNTSILTKSIKTIGIGEAILEEKIRKLNLNFKHINIATFSSDGIVEIQLFAKGKIKDKLKDDMEEITNILKSSFGSYIFTYKGETIEEKIIEILTKKNMTLGFCESCTGGLLSSKITSVSGASQIFDRGIITYSNNSKVEELGVKDETLSDYGAVSYQTAYEMAKGLLKKKNLDIVASVTGIAGPNSDSTSKPVGLVYICVMTRDNYEIEECKFYGNRNSIQNKASIKALELVWKMLK